MARAAVLRIIMSNDSIKNATAMSHGSSLLLVSDGLDELQPVRVDWMDS
jgi:hypothetical protein